MRFKQIDVGILHGPISRNFKSIAAESFGATWKMERRMDRSSTLVHCRSLGASIMRKHAPISHSCRSYATLGSSGVRGKPISMSNGSTRKRGMAYYRKVPFPPSDRFPFSWIFYSLFLLQDFRTSVMGILELQVEELVRQSRSEAWGVDRVVNSLMQIREALGLNHGSSYMGFINAAPKMEEAQILEKSVIPNMQSDDPDVVYQAAKVLEELLLQRHLVSTLSSNQKVLDVVIDGLVRWQNVNCVDCGNPAPTVGALLRALQLILEEDKSLVKAHLPEIIPVIENIAKKVENAKKERRKRTILEGSFSTRVGGIRGRQDVVAHRSDWYFDTGSTLAEMCETICTKYPEFSLKLIPSFGALTRTLCPVDISSMDVDSGDELDILCPTYDTAFLLFKTVDDAGNKRPEHVPAQDWNYLLRVRPFFEAAHSQFGVKFIHKLEYYEDKFEPVFSFIQGMALGFLWGGLRSIIALRNVTDPSGLASYEPPMQAQPSPQQTYYQYSPPPQQQPAYPPNGPGNYYPQNGGYMPSQQHHGYPGAPQQPHHQFPQQQQQPQQFQKFYQPHHNPAWKRQLILKHARLAALGTGLLVIFHEAMNAVSRHIWIKDEKKQIGLASLKVVFDMSLLLGVLRNAPYCFIPMLFSVKLDFDDLSEQNIIVVETN